MAQVPAPDIAVKGALVPRLGFGTWQLTGRACREAVRTAIDVGYRHIDTAQLYGNESEVGAGIRAGGVARDALFVTTKLDPGSMTAAAVRRSAAESLDRLGLGHVDLLLIHWPSPRVPMGETLGAMAELKRDGLVRHLGVSNFTTALLREAVETHRADLLCNQVEYHPFLLQKAVLPSVRGYGMLLAAYCPLARGGAVGDAVLSGIGKRYGKSAAQVCLRWLIEQEGVVALPKAAGRAHMAANIDIFDFALTERDRAEIAALPKGRRIVDWSLSPEWDAA